MPAAFCGHKSVVWIAELGFQQIHHPSYLLTADQFGIDDFPDSF